MPRTKATTAAKKATKPRTKRAAAKKAVKPRTKRAPAKKAAAKKSKRQTKPAKKAKKKGGKSKRKKEESDSEEEEPKAKRKINMKPTLSDKAGLNISVARVKNVIDTYVINRAEAQAAAEIRHAAAPPRLDEEGKVVKETVTNDEGKEVERVVTDTPIPLKKLSKSTRKLVEHAAYFYDRAEKEKYEKAYVKDLNEEETTAYNDARKEAKEEFERRMRTVPEFRRDVFDIEAFNTSYDEDFYKDFTPSEPDEKATQWSVALGHLSKFRVRFSANSKVQLSAFMELLLKQLALNGTHNCIKSGKKIIKLNHALTMTDGTEAHFPLMHLVATTEAYRAWQRRMVRLAERAAAKAERAALRKKQGDDYESESDEEDEEEEEETEEEGRLNFRFYVSEICREVRMSLASGELTVQDDPTEDLESYNLTNVSREFKDFCNSLIFEVVEIIGRMILTEINTRGVKTLNDGIMKTVLEHLHSAYGLDFVETLEFIESTTDRYNSYVQARRVERKEKKLKEKESQDDSPDYEGDEEDAE